MKVEFLIVVLARIFIDKEFPMIPNIPTNIFRYNIFARLNSEVKYYDLPGRLLPARTDTDPPTECH